MYAHGLYINVPDRGQSQVIQSLRRAKFIVPHWRERERERENRLVGVLQPECSKCSDFPSRVVRSIHCYIVAFDSSLIFRQQGGNSIHDLCAPTCSRPFLLHAVWSSLDSECHHYEFNSDHPVPKYHGVLRTYF